MQAKIGNESFEDSLQALRGSDADVSLEAVEIKVFFCSKCAHSVVLCLLHSYFSFRLYAFPILNSFRIIHFPIHFHFQMFVHFFWPLQMVQGIAQHISKELILLYTGTTIV
jgi:hypothetical protein